MSIAIKPVIAIAFANDQTAHLDTLERERRGIYDTLRPYLDKDLVHVEKVEHASVQDFFNFINHYEQGLHIFHYGGHASGTHLQLEASSVKGEQASSQGLSDLLAQLPNLKLVFLNGCATLPQVETLLSKGIKVVIATSTPINDSLATEFSIQFYKSLATNATLERAFLIAKALVTTKRAAQPIDTFRGFSVKNKPSQQKAFAWGLYYQDEKALQWQLPQQPSQRKAIPQSAANFKLNDVLIKTLYKELANQSSDFRAVLVEMKRQGRIEMEKLKREMIDAFHMPIGEQIRKLFAKSTEQALDEFEQLSLPRLQQLVATYEISIQILCFTLLAQLWDARNEHPKEYTISKELKVELEQLFALNKFLYPFFNYHSIISWATDFFKKHKIPFFIPDLEEFSKRLSSPQDEYVVACRDLEELKLIINQNLVEEEQIPALCIQAEEKLAIVLRDLSFLVKYKLVSIKDVSFQKLRHEAPKYLPRRVFLDRALTGRNDETEMELTQYMDVCSVVLFKEIDGKTEYLNLSPFIFDFNAFTGDAKSKLYLFAYKEDGDKYYFSFVKNREEYIALPGVDVGNLNNIKTLFERFKNCVLGHDAEVSTNLPPKSNDLDLDFLDM